LWTTRRSMTLTPALSQGEREAERLPMQAVRFIQRYWAKAYPGGDPAQNSPTCSPPDTVARSRSCEAAEYRKNLTEPSTNRKLAPPGCKLQ
jgi:hypothetical protein